MIGHFKEIKYIDVNPYTMEPFRTESLDERIKRLRSFFFEGVKVDSNNSPVKVTDDSDRKKSNLKENGEAIKRTAGEHPVVRTVFREAVLKNPRSYSFPPKHPQTNTVGDCNWKTSNLEEKVETIRRTIGERPVINTLCSEFIPKPYSINSKQSPMTVVGDSKWKKPLSEGKIPIVKYPTGERPVAVVPHKAINRISSSDKVVFNNPLLRPKDDSNSKKLRVGEQTKSNEYSVRSQPVVASIPSEVASKDSKPIRTEPKKPVTEDNSKERAEKTGSSVRIIGKRRAALLLKAKTQYNEQLLKLCQRRVSKANKRLARIKNPTLKKKDEAIFKRIWREEEEEVEKLLKECILKTVVILETEIKREESLVDESAEIKESSVHTPPDVSPLIDVMNQPPETNAGVSLMQPAQMYPQRFSQSMNMAIPYNYTYGSEQVFAFPAWYYDAHQIYTNNYQMYTNNYQVESNYFTNDNQTNGNYSTNDYQKERHCSTKDQVDSSDPVNNNQMDGNYSVHDCQVDDEHSTNDDQMDGNYSANDNEMIGDSRQ
ncbi:hypothetical protein FO519_004161 [Halicephalobus sp. NKZ332]|nr:hypothetical protein FO519_004161 [Halicephalobus sp. NKZ332]